MAHQRNYNVVAGSLAHMASISLVSPCTLPHPCPLGHKYMSKSPSERMSICPSSNITPYPMSSDVDTESNFIFGTYNNHATSKETLDSSWNLTHPTPFTTCVVHAPLFKWQSEPFSETLRNIDLIPVIWWDDSLPTTHPQHCHLDNLLKKLKFGLMDLLPSPTARCLDPYTNVP